MSYSEDARLITSRYAQAKRAGLPLWACNYIEWRVHEAKISNRFYRDKSNPKDQRNERWKRARRAQCDVLELLGTFRCNQATLRFPPGSPLQPPERPCPLKALINPATPASPAQD